MKRWLGTVGFIGTVGVGGVSSPGAYAEPATRRTLTVVHEVSNGGDAAIEVWAFARDGRASWYRLNPVPDLPLRELAVPAPSLDATKRRLFITGAGGNELSHDDSTGT